MQPVLEELQGLLQVETGDFDWLKIRNYTEACLSIARDPKFPVDMSQIGSLRNSFEQILSVLEPTSLTVFHRDYLKEAGEVALRTWTAIAPSTPWLTISEIYLISACVNIKLNRLQEAKQSLLFCLLLPMKHSLDIHLSAIRKLFLLELAVSGTASPLPLSVSRSNPDLNQIWTALTRPSGDSERMSDDLSSPEKGLKNSSRLVHPEEYKALSNHRSIENTLKNLRSRLTAAGDWDIACLLPECYTAQKLCDLSKVVQCASVDFCMKRFDVSLPQLVTGMHRFNTLNESPYCIENFKHAEEDWIRFVFKTVDKGHQQAKKEIYQKIISSLSSFDFKHFKQVDTNKETPTRLKNVETDHR